MKWIDGETWEHRKERLSKWHKWFAWYPIKLVDIKDGHYIKVWLQYVERSGYLCYSAYGLWSNERIIWIYREIK